MCIYTDGSKEDRGRFFLRVPREQINSKQHKYNHNEYHLNILKIPHFCCEGGQTVEQVAQRGSGDFIPEDMQGLTGYGPG